MLREGIVASARPTLTQRKARTQTNSWQGMLRQYFPPKSWLPPPIGNSPFSPPLWDKLFPWQLFWKCRSHPQGEIGVYTSVCVHAVLWWWTKSATLHIQICMEPCQTDIFCFLVSTLWLQDTESKRFTFKDSVLPDAGNLKLFERLGLEVEVPSLWRLASQPCFQTCFSRCKRWFYTISYNRSVGPISVIASIGNGKPMQKSAEYAVHL